MKIVQSNPSAFLYIFMLSALLILLGAPTLHSATLDVCKIGCPYNRITDALKASSAGDTIRVATGTYKEEFVPLREKPVSIEGGWSEDFTTRSYDPSSTVLEGELNIMFDQVGGTMRIETLTIIAPTSVALDISTEGANPVSIDLNSVILRDAESAGMRVVFQGMEKISVRLTNCLIFSNANGIIAMASNGTAQSPASITLTNCTIAFNQSSGIVLQNADAQILNSIIWGNPIQGLPGYTTAQPIEAADIVVGASSFLTIDHSLLGTIYNENATHLTDLGNNIIGPDKDPMFKDPQYFDLHLLKDSPCIDAGGPGVGVDIDFEGDPRPMGLGIDIGADEYDPCQDDTTPPDPVEGLSFKVSPFTIGLSWKNPSNAPYDIVQFYEVEKNGNEHLLYEVGRDQHEIILDNTYTSGHDLRLKAVTLDKCGNQGQPVEITIPIPAYTGLHCPAGSFNFTDLRSILHVANTSDANGTYFAYGFDEDGKVSWEQSGVLGPKESTTITPPQGISASVFSTTATVGMVELNGLNGTSARFPCTTHPSTMLYMAENVCSEEWWSGVLLYNPSNISANVTVETYYNSKGHDTQGFTLAPWGSAVYIPPCQALSGTFSATTPIAAMEIAGNQHGEASDIGAMLLPGDTAESFTLTGIHDGKMAWTGLALFVPYTISEAMEIELQKFSNHIARSTSLGFIDGLSRRAFNVSEPEIDGARIAVAPPGGQEGVQMAAMAIQSTMVGFDLLDPGVLGSRLGFITGLSPTATNIIYAFNPWDVDMEIRVTVYDQGGATTTQKTVVIPARGGVSGTLTGEEASGIGLIELSSDLPIYGLIEERTASSVKVLPILNVDE